MNDYDPYLYKCKIDRVIDGDTIDVVISLGFYLTKKVRVRLKGVDTHETYGVPKESEEYSKGIKEKRFVKNWLENDSDEEFPFYIRTKKKGKYGRYLGDIIYNDEVLNEELSDNFFGLEYE